jgi:hypothetical protein
MTATAKAHLTAARRYSRLAQKQRAFGNQAGAENFERAATRERAAYMKAR